MHRGRNRQTGFDLWLDQQAHSDKVDGIGCGIAQFHRVRLSDKQKNVK
jgi:hypothetical protein